MELTVSWLLQIAILASGIYLFLRFLRTTRGGGLLRGLFVAFLIAAIGIYGAANTLDLEELSHIIEGFTPYVVVILVILFQPELRRGMVRLGQHSRFAQLFAIRRHETVAEVASAATSMAKRRHGALIAFQRESPLDAWTQNAARIDAEVSRHLLESIFQPGGALHDGAVVIEGDRVVAAACLFPLTENIEVSKSTGTRHRAALGLTEETDAITLAVSEETGRISISHQGKMDRDIPPAELEPSLRRHLGLSAEETTKDEHSGWGLRRIFTGLWALFTQDLVRKASAILLATGLIFIANQQLIGEGLHMMPVKVLGPADMAIAQPGYFTIRLPDESIHLVHPGTGDMVRLASWGTTAETNKLKELGGLLQVDAEIQEGLTTVSLDEVTWSQRLGNVRIEWAGNAAPVLEVVRYAKRSWKLEPTHVPVDDSQRDLKLEVRKDGIIFEPTSIEIEGPPALLQEIVDGVRPFELATITVTSNDLADKRIRLGLAPELIALGMSIVGESEVFVTLPIEPAPRGLGEIEMDIVVTNMDPDSAIDTGSWAVSQADAKAVFDLNSAGLFDSDPDTDAFAEDLNRIRRFVTANLKVYVDVSELPEEGTVVPLHYDFPRHWREELFAGREQGLAPSAILEVKLKSSATILLTEKK